MAFLISNGRICHLYKRCLDGRVFVPTPNLLGYCEHQISKAVIIGRYIYGQSTLHVLFEWYGPPHRGLCF